MNIRNIENFLIILLFSLAAKKEFTNGQSSKSNLIKIYADLDDMALTIIYI